MDVVYCVNGLMGVGFGIQFWIWQNLNQWIRYSAKPQKSGFSASLILTSCKYGYNLHVGLACSFNFTYSLI